jgi:PAS domain S-box-containing protein
MGHFLSKTAGPIWGLASALVVMGLWTQWPFSDPLHRVEYGLYDLRMKRRSAADFSPGSQVVVVGINENDQRELGPLPWPRTRYADLIRRLANAGAKAIVLDLFFPDTQSAPGDTELAQAIADSGIVFLPERSLQIRTPADADASGVYRGTMVRNHPLFRQEAAGQGHINVLVDPDGIVRRMPARVGPPQGTGGSTQLPLGLVAVLRALDAQGATVTAADGVLKAGPLTIPLDPNACIPIRYLNFDREVYIRPPYAPRWVEAEGRKRPVLICSFQEAMGSAAGDPTAPPPDVAGKVVVVAGTLQGSEADMHSTPFARQYGALIHAAFIHSLLERQFIRVPGETPLFLALLLLGIPLGIAAFRIRLSGSSYTAVAGMVLTLTGSLTALGLLSWLLYSEWGWMIQVTPLGLLVTLNFGAALAANLSRASREAEQTRRAAEQVLRESEAYLKSVLDSVRAGIVVIEPATREVLDANAYAAEMLGGARADLVGQDCRRALCQERNATCPVCDLQQPEHSAEIRIERDGSTPLDLLTTATRVTRHGHAYVIESFIDISNRKKAESELRESNQRLKDALDELADWQRQVVQQERLRALGEMASGVAHDFNNALMPVVGYTDMLLMSPELLDEKEKSLEFLRHVRRAAEDAQGVVQRLREFYRRRDEDDALASIDLNQIIRDALSLTQPKWKEQAQAHGKTITIDPDLTSLPDTVGNETELRELLTNLIFNAVDAMPDGGTLTIATRLENEHIELAVSDTGHGMDEETRERCLEPFFTTKGERGTGLGLSVTYGIIRRHGGTIDLTSQEGQGTCFRIRLPVHRDPEAREMEPPAAGNIQPLRVLAVDDDPAALRVLLAYLQADGHAVATAENAEQALARLEEDTFDLVITDMAMPAMSGDQLASAIKRRSPETPVVLLSGFAPTAHEPGKPPSSSDLILSKPITLTAFREAMLMVVGTQNWQPD